MASSNGNDGLFLFPKVFMKFGGVWPTERQTGASVAIFCFNLALQIILAVSLLVDWLRTDTLKQQHWNYVGLPVTIATHVIIRAYGGQMASLIKATIGHWSSTTDPKEQEIMKNHKKMGSYFFVFMFAYSVVSPTVMSIIFWINFLLYFDKALPEERTALTDDFLWTFFIPLLNIVITFLSNVTVYGVGLLFWSLAMQLSAQFKIQTRRYQRFLRIKSKSQTRHQLRRLVDRHNQVLDVHRRFEDAFHLYLGLRVFWLQVLICILAYYVADSIAQYIFKNVFYGSAYLTVNFSFLYVFYYVSDYLASCSEDIGEVFRQCKWYTLSKDSRVNFSIAILRTQATRTLTLGKLYKLNLLNFQYVVQSVYGYISLIVAIAQEEDP